MSFEFKNHFKKTLEKIPEQKIGKKKEKREYINPTLDGWEKIPTGGWRRWDGEGMEFLGNISPVETLSEGVIESFYIKRKELETSSSNKDKEALKSLNKRIEYLEKYGPEVMGGVK
ncbi:MAG: hypothetical protein WCS86_02185 [Candidatus Paceibacterota bacterium]